MSNFKNLVEVCEYFKHRETCHKYLAAIRWKDGINCPHCSSNAICCFKDGMRYTCKDCKKQFNALTNTIFENTKIPLQKWFAALWLLSCHKKGISSMQVAHDLNITQKSAWFMMHRLRQMLSGGLTAKLKGTVEVDETYIGGKSTNKKHAPKGEGWANKFVVVGVVERQSYLRLIHVPYLSGQPVTVVEKLVVEKATVYTDEYNAYKRLKNKGYKHSSVNHGIQEYARDIIHTNTIEGAFGLFKRMYIGTYHYMSFKHLQRYCDELSYRYSTRKLSDTDRFNDALDKCQNRLKYYQLTGVQPIEKMRKEEPKKLAPINREQIDKKSVNKRKQQAIEQRIKDGYPLPNRYKK